VKVNYLNGFISTFYSTIIDVLPIVILIAFFQYVVIKKPIPEFKKVALGLLFVVVGLTLFLLGLEKALFPIGELMAKQLASEEFILKSYSGDLSDWQAYYWIYLFAGLMGFSTTIAEPSLLAVAIKANEVSGGTISQWGIRIVVALGVAISLAIGTFRIVTGTSMHLYILGGYAIVSIQTIFANKDIVALAYDSGGVTTSTVTVPIVAALGLGLSSAIPGRNPALDGFGLIAFASVFPVMAVLTYSNILEVLKKVKTKRNEI
jgi:hypothetical protein